MPFPSVSPALARFTVLDLTRIRFGLPSSRNWRTGAGTSSRSRALARLLRLAAKADGGSRASGRRSRQSSAPIRRACAGSFPISAKTAPVIGPASIRSRAEIFMLDFQDARCLMDNEIAKQAGNNHPTVCSRHWTAQHRDHRRQDLGALGRSARSAEWIAMRPMPPPRHVRCKSQDALNAVIEAFTPMLTTGG